MYYNYYCSCNIVAYRIVGGSNMANYRNNNVVLANKLRNIIKQEMDRTGILIPELAKNQI